MTHSFPTRRSSDLKGNRQSMHWFIPKSKEDVIKRRKYTEFLCRHFKGGIFTRPPAGMNVVMITQVDDQEPWVKNSRFKNGERDLSGNIQRDRKSTRLNSSH